MGTLFWLFSHLASYLTILALALALSSGLYMISMFAEEFPTTTGRYLKYLAVGVTVTQLLLWIDGLPTFESAVQLGALAAYATLLQSFPFVCVLSWQVFLSVGGFFATNLFWLQFFLKEKLDALSVLSFFVVVVWAVPCGLVASLSVEDYSLPASEASVASSTLPDGSKRKSTFRMYAELLIEKIDFFNLLRSKRTS